MPKLEYFLLDYFLVEGVVAGEEPAVIYEAQMFVTVDVPTIPVVTILYILGYVQVTTLNCPAIPAVTLSMALL